MVSGEFGRISTALALGAVLALGACGGDRAGDDESQTGSAGGSISGETTGAGGQPTTAGQPANALNDRNIVAILDAANAADSTTGTLAMKKGTHADVRSYGRMMANEHHALREQGQQLAKRLNVEPEMPSNDQSEEQHEDAMERLNDLPKGAEWDRAYIAHEVAYHQQVLETATAARDAAQNQELRALIEKAAPIIQKHLDRAREIQKRLGEPGDNAGAGTQGNTNSGSSPGYRGRS